MRTSHAVVAILILLVLLAGSSAEAYSTVGIVDSAGKIVIPCEYRRIEKLSNGFFYAEKLNKDNPVFESFDGCILDNEGKLVEVKLPEGCTLSRVFLPVNGTRRKYSKLPPGTVLEIWSGQGFGLCKPDGSIILKPTYAELKAPINGRIPVMKGERASRTSLQLFFDFKTGKQYPVSIDAHINDAKHGALIPFLSNYGGSGGYGYLTTDAKVTILPKFESAGEFDKAGVARVSFNHSQSSAYINSKGKIISPVFDSAGDFENNIAIAGTTSGGKTKYGLINRKFKYVVDPKYDQLVSVFGTAYAVQEDKDGDWKVIAADGKLLFALPPETKAIQQCDDAIMCITDKRPPEKTYTLVNKSGRVTTGVDLTQRMPQPEIVASNRFLKYERHEKFHPAVWRSPNAYGVGLNRVEQFASFLKDHDLIGMQRVELLKLLGEIESVGRRREGYQIAHGVCGNAATNIEIEFDHSCVSRWREIGVSCGESYEAPWVTTNVLLKIDDDWGRRLGTEPLMKVVGK
jgi:hypothetical protein